MFVLVRTMVVDGVSVGRSRPTRAHREAAAGRKHRMLIPEGSGEKSIDRDSRYFLSVDEESSMTVPSAGDLCRISITDTADEPYK